MQTDRDAKGWRLIMPNKWQFLFSFGNTIFDVPFENQITNSLMLAALTAPVTIISNWPVQLAPERPEQGFSKTSCIRIVSYR
jgi:hypothetical protein